MGHALQQARNVGGRNNGDFAEVALALPVLALREVTLALLATQQLAGTRFLKTLGHGFSRFGFSIAGHRDANLTRLPPLGNGFSMFIQWLPIDRGMEGFRSSGQERCEGLVLFREGMARGSKVGASPGDFSRLIITICFQS